MVLLVRVPPAHAGDAGDVDSIPGSGRSPGGGKWQPTPVFLPGKSHGQRRTGGLQSIGSQRVRHDWVTEHVCMQSLLNAFNILLFIRICLLRILSWKLTRISVNRSLEGTRYILNASFFMSVCCIPVPKDDKTRALFFSISRCRSISPLAATHCCCHTAWKWRD